VFFSATIFPGVLNLVPEKMRVWVQIIAWGILTAFALFGISVLDIKEYVSKLVRRQLLKMQE
jgi:purine-cytosine permease-like protein